MSVAGRYQRLSGDSSREKAKGGVRGVETMLEDVAIKASRKMDGSWSDLTSREGALLSFA